MATTLWLGWWRSLRSVRDLRHSLASQQAERDGWRASAEQALEGLGRAMDAQFGRWALTPSEREVALLLLKGYSHKAIARSTGRSDQTVRQHAAAVYRKASLGGRAELADDARFMACRSYEELSPDPQLDQEYTRAAIDHCCSLNGPRASGESVRWSVGTPKTYLGTMCAPRRIAR